MNCIYFNFVQLDPDTYVVSSKVKLYKLINLDSRKTKLELGEQSSLKLLGLT